MSPLKIAEEYAERIWNKKEIEAIDTLVDENVIVHSLLGDFTGRSSIKKVVQAWLQAFPDLRVQTELSICEKDLVTLKWSAKGTHLGPFKEIAPTGKKVSYSGVTLYRIHGDKIIEYWAYLDLHHLLNQLR